MAQQTSPWIEGKYGWSFGESGWNPGMDEDLLKFSFMFDRNVDSITAALPPAVNGQAHYLTTDNRLYFAVGTTYYSTVVPKWFTVIVRGTGATHQFNGTSLIEVDTSTELSSRLSAVEITIAALGSAAFEDVSFFATTADLDIAEAVAAAYTDSQVAPLQAFDTNLGDLADPTLGAAGVGRAVRHVNDLAELRALAGQYSGEVVYLRERAIGDGLGAGNFKADLSSVLADNDATVIVASDGTRWFREGVNFEFHGEWAGVGNQGLDYTTNWQNAINLAAEVAGAAQGMDVILLRGTIGISDTIDLPNRVVCKGANGRATVIKPLPGFAGAYMFHAANGTSSMFGSRLEDMHIDARGVNLSAVVYSQAWQETCGLERVVIQYDGTTPNAFLYENGYGGAALLKFKDVEIFSDSTAASNHAIRINQVSVVGGFLFMIENSTITGSVANPLVHAINMVNDSLMATGLHVEYCNNAIVSQGAGNLDVTYLTGSVNAVVDLVTIGGSYTGKANLRSILPNGATGQIFKNNVTGQNIAASGQRVASHVYPVPGFNATVSAQIPNVTGNGTTYTVLFNSERYDLGQNFAAGIFTAPEAGKHQLDTAVKFTAPATATTCLVQIVTTSKTYTIFRGSLASLIDASGTVTIGGGVSTDMALGHTARVNVMVSGVGADTVDIEATETWFSGYKLGW